MMLSAVHGRFQPFHNGHLEYALRAYLLSDLLYIGITNSDASHMAPDSASEHRHLTEANPFPFHARLEMILGAMKEAGADLDKLRVVPFPINHPNLIDSYVPREATHYLCAFDEWGTRKLHILKSQGLTAIGWTDMSKRITGTRVRKALDCGESINTMVPPFVAKYLSRGGH